MLQRMQVEQNFNVFEFVTAMRENRTYMVQTLVSWHAHRLICMPVYVVPFVHPVQLQLIIHGYCMLDVVSAVRYHTRGGCCECLIRLYQSLLPL